MSVKIFAMFCLLKNAILAIEFEIIISKIG